MAHVLEAWQDGNGVFETLSFDFPVLLSTDSVDLLSDVQNTFCVVGRNSVEHIQAVDPDVDSWIAQSYESIVEKNIKPLLVELFFVWDEEGMTSIHDLIIL